MGASPPRQPLGRGPRAPPPGGWSAGLACIPELTHQAGGECLATPTSASTRFPHSSFPGFLFYFILNLSMCLRV